VLKDQLLSASCGLATKASCTSAIELLGREG
jgi:hypothetical protein